MADRHAIEELFARYAEGNDKRDADIIASTLAEDASFTIHIADSDSHGPFEPRTGIMEFIGAALGAQSDRRRHLITNLTVLDQADDRARVNAYLTLIVTDGGRTEVKSAGIYETEVVNQGGEWRFGSMVLTLDNPF